MGLKESFKDFADAVRRSNEEMKSEIGKAGVKGALAKSFSELGFIKNRADRVINQLNQSQWVSAHEPGFFDTGLAYDLQKVKSIQEKNGLLDAFDRITPVGRLRNWIDKLAASSTSYAAIRSFQKREQVKTKLTDFSKRLENDRENREFKKSRKSLNETNQKLFDDLIELREGRKIQEDALKMVGNAKLRAGHKERVEQAIKDRAVAETLISAQISANLEIHEGEVDLKNKKISLMDGETAKIDAEKDVLNKQGYMAYLFDRTFKLADGFTAEIQSDGIVVVYDPDGNAIAPNDPVLDPNNPDGVIQIDETEKGDMFAESIAEFQDFSVANIGLTPKTMASRYSRAMRDKLKAAIAEGRASGYLDGIVAKNRMEKVESLLTTLNKTADRDYYKKTKEYKEYQETVSREKMAIEAERFNLYQRVLEEYQTLLGDDEIREFTERIANLPEKSARAKAYSQLKRELIDGLPGTVLAIGGETLDQMFESIREISESQREIGQKYIEPFLGATYLSQGPLANLPAKAPDGTYLVYDPDSKAGKENGGVKVVATFEEAKKYYSFLESPEDLAEFLESPEFRESSSIDDMTEAEFLSAIESHQLIPTKIVEYKENYDKFISQTASLDYVRDRAIEEVQKGVEAGEVQLNATTRAYLAPNDDGKQTWFIEENGQTRELLDDSELLSIETLDEDAIYGFIETKIMPIKLKELDGLTFNKENELVDENGNPVIEESEKALVQERIDDLSSRFQQEYIDNIIENSREPVGPDHSPSGATGPVPTGPSGPAPSGMTGSNPSGPSGPAPSGMTGSNPSGPTPTGPSGASPSGMTGSGPSGATGPTAGGGSIKYNLVPYKVGDVNVAGIIKFLQVKKCMSYDLIAESAERLAKRYADLSALIPTPKYAGSYTIDNNPVAGDDEDNLEHTEDESEHTEDEADHTEDETDHTEDESEHTEDETDHTEDEADHTEDETDHTEDESEHTEDEADHTEDETDHTEDETDHTEDETDHTEDETDHTEDEADHTEDETDHTEDETDHTEDETDHTEDETDHTEDETDHTEDETDHTEDETDHTEDETDHTEDETDHTEDEDRELEDIEKELAEAERARIEAEKAKAEAEKGEADFEEKYQKYLKQEQAYEKAKAEAEKALDDGAELENIAEEKQKIAEAEGASIEAEKAKAEAEKGEADFEEKYQKYLKQEQAYEKAKAEVEKALDDGAELENIAEEKQKIADSFENADKVTGDAVINSGGITAGEDTSTNGTETKEESHDDIIARLEAALNGVGAPTGTGTILDRVQGASSSAGTSTKSEDREMAGKWLLPDNNPEGKSGDTSGMDEDYNITF